MTPHRLPWSPAAMFWLPLLALCAAGGALRGAMLAEYLRCDPLSEILWSDAGEFWKRAGQISAGKWIDDTPFLSAPLYPYLLGALRRLGLDKSGVYVTQVVLHVLTTIPVALAARRRAGTAGGLLAAGLFLSLTEPAVSSMRMLANTLELALAALLLWRWSALADALVPADGRGRDAPPASPGVQPRDALPPAPRAGPRAARIPIGGVLGAGALLGLLALAWPPGVLLIPIFAAWLVWAGRRAARRVLAGALAVVVPVAFLIPAALHNWRAAGEFIPLTAHAGITLRQGNAPGSVGVYTKLDGISRERFEMHADAAKLFQAAHGRPGSWREIDAHFRRQALAWWAEDPARALVLALRKACWYLASRRYDDMMLAHFERDYGVWQRALLAPLGVPWMIGAALAGLLARRRSPARHAPEWSMLLLTLLVCVVFFYSPRYRLPAVPAICVLAAVGVRWLLALERGRLAAFALVAMPVLFDYLNPLLGVDRLESVRPRYVAALSKSAWLCGDVRLAEGDPAAAERHFRTALRLEPENPAALRRLGVLCLDTGREQEAVRHLTALIEGGSTDLPAFEALHDALIAVRDYRGADRLLRRAARLVPESARPHVALAWLLATCPQDDLRNPQEALAQARTALALAPEDRGGALDRRNRAAALDALAAAHAAAGEFDDAVAAARSAAELARSVDPAAAAAIDARLAQYLRQEPCRGEPLFLRSLNPRPPP